MFGLLSTAENVNSGGKLAKVTKLLALTINDSVYLYYLGEEFATYSPRTYPMILSSFLLRPGPGQTAGFHGIQRALASPSQAFPSSSSSFSARFFFSLQSPTRSSTSSYSRQRLISSSLNTLERPLTQRYGHSALRYVSTAKPGPKLCTSFSQRPRRSYHAQDT